MGAYKQFLASDVIVTPFVVNKEFTFYSTPSSSLDSIDHPTVRINRLLGRDITGSSIFNPSSDLTTGYVYPGLEGGLEYQRLVYNSIKHIYYSNYLSSSYGDPVNNRILIPGVDEAGNDYIGSLHNPSYVNYLQSTLTFPRSIRFFPSQYTGSSIAVISIPNGLFGDYIKPNSVRISFSSSVFYDDGEGNLLTGSNVVGNVIYPHGVITLTGNQDIYDLISGTVVSNPAVYGTSIYGTGIYGGTLPSSWPDLLNSLITSTNFTCSFESSYVIYETQYKCTIRENEYNFTLNPSTISGSYTTSSNAGKVYDFVTSSYFSPFITTIGLYDEQQNLLAVGKLSQPLPSSPTTDTTILINIDR